MVLCMNLQIGQELMRAAHLSVPQAISSAGTEGYISEMAHSHGWQVMMAIVLPAPGLFIWHGG